MTEKWCRTGEHLMTAENTYNPPHRPGAEWCRACRRKASKRFQKRAAEALRLQREAERAMRR